MAAPSLIVFDLDLTLWDCGGSWCDCLSPPFRIRDDQVVDRLGARIRLYEDVQAILNDCDSRDIPMALASRTQEPDWARELLDLLGITDRFAYAEIYPASKFSHFSSLKSDSGIAYEEMLFFDDEMRNIHDVSQLGVTCIHVPNGINWSLFKDTSNQR